MAAGPPSASRLVKALNWEPIDRVPIFPPIPWDPRAWPPEGRPAGWMGEDNYLQVAELCARHCDVIVGTGALEAIFDRRFMLIPQEYIEVESQSTVNGRTTIRYRVRTPKGELYTTEAFDSGVATSWYPEPLLKDREDVARIKSVPYRFDPPDLDRLFEDRARLGDRGLMQIGVSTPLVSTGRMFEFGHFLEWAASERALIEDLIAIHAERIHERLQWLLEHGVGPVYWFGGSEQATPPMMSRGFYEDLVGRYDEPLMQLVRRHGCYVHVHCHGKVNGVLERVMDMGAHLFDPCEPPPDGDLDFADAKRRAGGRLVLLGNIEFRHLEFATPDEIERLVADAICRGGKEGMFLYPSATGIARISDRYRDNAIRYIEAGLRYGGISP
jgi:hypothetical protein